jgi:hypothetical protein
MRAFGALPGTGIPLAMQRRLVYIFDHWHSFDLHLRFRNQGESFYGSLSVLIISVSACGDSPCRHERSGRRSLGFEYNLPI